MGKKVLLLTLQTFSTTGGIQKMTRTLSNALYRMLANDFYTFSVYDSPHHLMQHYIPSECFRGFGGNRGGFVMKSITHGLTADVIILSHINLSVIGIILKKLSRKRSVWLIAHGIEVWRPLGLSKRMLLKYCDKIICVSNFTRQQMVKLHAIDEAKSVVLNNVIDPFMQLPVDFKKPEELLKRYNLRAADKVIFTLTRLAATEQYKGHEQVIRAVAKLKADFPAIKYILSGQYDQDEETRIKELIAGNNVEDSVILTGFLNEKELPDHFLLADVFVLPSRKEGFGIVFIEAMACGTPVICGDADGSIDAIRSGELGTAVNVEDLAALEDAISDKLGMPASREKRQLLQKQCLSYFNQQDYMKQLRQLINN